MKFDCEGSGDISVKQPDEKGRGLLPSGWDVEDLAVPGFVDGGYRPSNADTQEDVNGITARYIADRSIRVLVLNGSHFAGERVCVEGRDKH